MIRSKHSRLLRAAFCLTLTLTAAAIACGPDFYPDTFVRTERPDVPEQYVKGELGLLQPGFARGDLFVAYRYLTGGKLDSTEQTGWTPTIPIVEREYDTRPQERGLNNDPGPAAEEPIKRWVLARRAFRDPPSEVIAQEGRIEGHTSQGYQYESNFLNCADDAFRTATQTLEMRARLWGATSTLLLDWLHGQDAVFHNCAGEPSSPAAAPAGSPPLLVADRAYQVAAAHFYARAFDSAAREFAAISQDKSSPWQTGAAYLAARTRIREAFFARQSAAEQADYDPAILRQAEDLLRESLSGNLEPRWRHAAQKQLAMIQIRLHPKQRTVELAALVSGPRPDADYAQDLQDLLWITNARTPDGLRARPALYGQVQDEEKPGALRPVTAAEAELTAKQERETAFAGTADERTSAPILDWTLTFQSLAASASQHALAQWQSTHSQPWLVAALVLANDSEGAKQDLLDAAAHIPPSSPAYETVAYHRARLLLAGHRFAEARSVLEQLTLFLQQMPKTEREPSTVNAVRSLRMLAAASPSEFLRFVPRTLLLASSEEYSSEQECLAVMKDSKRHYDCFAEVDPAQLDADAARVLNEQAPLDLWLQAATSDSLSTQLRAAVAEEGWTRAILLHDQPRAASFLPLLPVALRAQAGNSPLAQWMTLARNPGLRPYLNAGVQRAYSYDFIESYRDNWCYQSDPDAGSPAAFLSQSEHEAGAAEARQIRGMRSLVVGQRIVAEVKANLHDPQSPEALFLVLRMIRYGCTQPEQPGADPATPQVRADSEATDLLKLRQEAARLLRQHYATSAWTRKAAPFVQ